MTFDVTEEYLLSWQAKPTLVSLFSLSFFGILRSSPAKTFIELSSSQNNADAPTNRDRHSCRPAYNVGSPSQMAVEFESRHQ
ncbi:hypothetical protein [uncultured Rhodoblastus sp.]|uniref:hypothetical protein n=1 Tax=uncultured Rhodoblastus sp. TaxID=543037 RepID=UPI0025EEE649|nr:hypothetical protein [uncultured Rhodoblastus sp.]